MRLHCKKKSAANSLVALALLACPAAAADEDSAIEPKAAQVLQQMSDYMNGLKQFTFRARNATDMVMKGNQTITLLASSRVSVKRPGRVRSDRIGELAKLQLFYDGRTFTLFEQSEKYYAQLELDKDLNGLLDHIRDSLGVEVPGADLLYENASEELLAAAESGVYVGTAEIEGVLCHHLAFRSTDVDWQIWIETGDRPLPRRYSLVSKWTTSAPLANVEFRDWDLSASLPDSMFQFQPPQGAKKIVFEEIDIDIEEQEANQ